MLILDNIRGQGKCCKKDREAQTILRDDSLGKRIKIKLACMEGRQDSHMAYEKLNRYDKFSYRKKVKKTGMLASKAQYI